VLYENERPYDCSEQTGIKYGRMSLGGQNEFD
jgi:hypothetical protein